MSSEVMGLLKTCRNCGFSESFKVYLKNIVAVSVSTVLHPIGQTVLGANDLE
jgi:hypothetical protein